MPTVAINAPKTPVTQGSMGIAAATLPNVCKMPGPPAPFVPVPLPNIGTSDNGPLGYSTTVKIEGNPVAIQGASFLSRGDIASLGTGGGIVSMNAHGPTTFLGPGSFDTRIENKNVQLLGDPMLNNNGPPGAPANSATMAGIVQPPLMAQALAAGILPEVQHICDVICDCKAAGQGNQACVSRRLYAEQGTSNIKPEVPFNMTPSDGNMSPSPYMSRNDPTRATRRWAIRGSRRPDVIIPRNSSEPWRGDNIQAVVEIKLGPDTWGPGQLEAYRDIASGAPVIELNDGPGGCNCPEDGEPEPIPFPVPQPQAESEEERRRRLEREREPFFPPGTGEVLATVALFAGVCLAGAALIASAPAWVPAAAGVAIVGGLAGLVASDSSQPEAI